MARRSTQQPAAQRATRPTAQRAARRRPPEEIGDKGTRTRELLIASALAVFAENGYFDSKLSDITDRAGVAAGTLYTYFDNREQLLAAIMADAYHDSVDPETARPVTAGDPVERIHHGNRHYVESFRAGAAVQKIIQETSPVDAGARSLRRGRAEGLFSRNAETIRALQSAGRVSADLDPETTARNLSLMVTRVCTYMYVEGNADARYTGKPGARRLADELTDTWLHTLGIAARP